MEPGYYVAFNLFTISRNILKGIFKSIYELYIYIIKIQQISFPFLIVHNLSDP